MSRDGGLVPSDHARSLARGLPAAARSIGRARRWMRGLLVQARHEAGRGNVASAVGLMLRYAVGL